MCFLAVLPFTLSAWGLSNCIDADAPIHESAPPSASSLEADDAGTERFSWAFPALMAAWAAGAGWIIVRRKLLRLPPHPRRDAAGISPGEMNAILVMLLFFVGLLLANQVGGVLALLLLDPPESALEAMRAGEITHETTRLEVLLRLGAYLSAGVVIAAWLILQRRFVLGSLAQGIAAPAAFATPGAAGADDSHSNRRMADTADAPTIQRSAWTRHGAAAIAGITGLLLLWPLLHWVSVIGAAVHARWTGQPPDVLAHEALAMLIDPEAGPWRFASMALVILGAPVVEEAAYRGLLQPAIAALLRSRWRGIIGASVIFVVPHIGAVSPHALPTLFVLSLGFGLVRERTGTLLAPIAMHAAFNGANVALAGLIGP